ncbi:MAG: hypothetical protein GY719_25225 [bacterium]|nr:hypothetical protein [bacterium]
MRRKAVTKRLKAIARLRSMIRVSGGELSERLARRPAAPRGEGFGYGEVFAHWDAELAAVERELAAAEDAYVRRKELIVTVRGLRDQAISDLYQEQTAVQGLLQSLPDSRELVLEGIAGAVPQDSSALALRARRTAVLLRRLQRTGRWRGDKVGVEVANLIEALEEGGRELEMLVSELEDAQAAVDAARCRAEERVAGVDGVVPWITRGLESLCRLAGQDGLAGRIRVR